MRSNAARMMAADGKCSGAAELSLDDDGARALARMWALGEAPTVRCMMNQSLDGAITGSGSTSASLSTPWDFFALTVLRGLADLILMGAETARAEGFRRPSGRACVRELSLRPSGTEYPALAVWTRSGTIPASLDPAWPTYLVTANFFCKEIDKGFCCNLFNSV